jgi:hypothetical protein
MIGRRSVRKSLIFLLVLILFVGASYALTPASAGDSESFRVFDPGNPTRQLNDTQHTWRLQRGGLEVLRYDRSNGELIGRYAVEREAGDLAVEWRSQHANGVIIAPRLFGRQLYRLEYITGRNGMRMILNLRPIMQRRPAL